MKKFKKFKNFHRVIAFTIVVSLLMASCSNPIQAAIDYLSGGPVEVAIPTPGPAYSQEEADDLKDHLQNEATWAEGGNGPEVNEARATARANKDAEQASPPTPQSP